MAPGRPRGYDPPAEQSLIAKPRRTMGALSNALAYTPYNGRTQRVDDVAADIQTGARLRANSSSRSANGGLSSLPGPAGLGINPPKLHQQRCATPTSAVRTLPTPVTRSRGHAVRLHGSFLRRPTNTSGIMIGDAVQRGL